jgi:Matrixin
MKHLKFNATLTCTILIFFAVAAHSAMLPMPAETLVESADVIVRGFVVATRSAPGERAGDIETLVDVHVAESIKGQAPPDFTLTVPGGALDGEFHFITDYPDFEQGQEVVLFLDESLEKLVGQIMGKATLESGMVAETMLGAEDYIKSLKRMARGQAPIVDIDVHFAPSSSIDGYVRRIGGKFAYDGLRWDSHSVRIYINENSSDTSGEGDAVRRSMSTWNSAPADFRFIDYGTHSRNQTELNNRNEIMWGSGDSEQAIAYTAIWGYGDNTIAECDMLFLNAYNWSAQGNPGYNEMDVENIATHEFGHYLCLLDLYNNWDSEKTMYGYGQTGETHSRTLHQDDINGIVHIYGAGPSTDDDSDDDDSDDDSDDDVDDDDDDDWWSDDDDDDDDWNPDSEADCGSALSLLYEECGYSIVASGSSWTGAEAMDACEQGSSPWDCVIECSTDDNVSNCSTFTLCLESACGVVTTSGDSSGDDDTTGQGGCVC